MFGIRHQLYGFLTGIVGEFCFFEMGLTHSNFTKPVKFVSENDAQHFLQETYPESEEYAVVRL